MKGSEAADRQVLIWKRQTENYHQWAKHHKVNEENYTETLRLKESTAKKSASGCRPQGPREQGKAQGND